MFAKFTRKELGLLRDALADYSCHLRRLTPDGVVMGLREALASAEFSDGRKDNISTVADMLDEIKQALLLKR
jgi:hypothetical protein